MKVLGLIGGTSWHSTTEYYRNINQAVNDHFGDNTNPPLLLFNLNQSAVHAFQKEDNWEAIADLIIEAALSLQKAGAEALILCANTPHRVYELVSIRVKTPILHIADATAAFIQKKGIKKVGFIGTKFTMEQNFITDRISQRGIEVLVPKDKEVIDELHRIIQQELTFGEVKESSKAYVTNCLMSMIEQGAEGIILGCTEFPLMFTAGDLPVSVFNTTEIHSKTAVDYILGIA